VTREKNEKLSLLLLEHQEVAGDFPPHQTFVSDLERTLQAFHQKYVLSCEPKLYSDACHSPKSKRRLSCLGWDRVRFVIFIGSHPKRKFALVRPRRTLSFPGQVTSPPSASLEKIRASFWFGNKTRIIIAIAIVDLNPEFQSPLRRN